MRHAQTIPTFSPLSVVATVMAVGTIVWACADAPTKPKSPALVTSTSRSAVIATRDVAMPLIDDASNRLAAAVEHAVTRDRVRELLKQLSIALAAGEEKTARTQITNLRRVIEDHADAGDASDLAGISLALDHIVSQLDAAAAKQ